MHPANSDPITEVSTKDKGHNFYLVSVHLAQLQPAVWAHLSHILFKPVTLHGWRCNFGDVFILHAYGLEFKSSHIR